MTLEELYNELLLEISPSISDDTSIDERLLKAFIHHTRALFVRNELNKSHRTVDSSLIQDLGLVELEAVNDVIDFGLDNINSKILRTVNTIPRALELHTKPAITFIGTLKSNGKGFKLVDIANLPYAGSGKFNKNFIYAVLMNDRIYLTGNCNNTAFKGLKYINVKGVFENPEEAGKFKKEDGTPCYSDHDEYPLPAYMWMYVKRSIIESDLRHFYIPIEDPINNANNDINRLNQSLVDNRDRRRRRYEENND